MTRLTAEKAILTIISLIYLILGTLFATQTPAWQAPDEPAHYNYVAQVASEGCCPVIEPGDWNQSYLSELTTGRFHPNLLNDFDTIQYEDHQPPLYYLLASVIWKLTDGGLIALRLFSVLLGAIVVFSAYEIGKTILPNHPGVALGAAAFVAFLPQHVAMLASVNNDALAEVIIAWTLLETLRYLKGANIPLWRLGLWIGIGFLTKTTTFFLAGIVPLAIIMRWWMLRDNEAEDRPNTLVLARALAWCLIPALLLGGIWWARNLGAYGVPDFLGLRAHDGVVADQPRTADGIELMGFNAYLGEGITTTFNSFWGQFGWMGLPMEARIYTVLKLFTALIVVGLGIDIFYLRQHTSSDTVQRHLWTIMALTVLLGFVAYIYYNTEFQQFQGRYLFPTLIPIGLWVAVGVDAWRRLMLRLLPETIPLRQIIFHAYATVVVLFALAALDLYLILRVIPPALHY